MGIQVNGCGYRTIPCSCSANRYHTDPIAEPNFLYQITLTGVTLNEH